MSPTDAFGARRRRRARGAGCPGVLRLAAGALGVAAGAYAANALRAWARYGHPSAPGDPREADELLDRLLPRHDVVERHHIAIDAPATIAYQAACAIDIEETPLARTIFRARELLMGVRRTAERRSGGFVADMRALGWGVLAEVPDREIVMGGVTKPWEAQPVFRALPPDEFARFSDPDYVKIAFTLRVDPVDRAAPSPAGPPGAAPSAEDRCVFRTETRALATDEGARRKFRWYWAWLSPGIVLIRFAILRPLKTEAERRARARQADAAVPAAPGA